MKRLISLYMNRLIIIQKVKSVGYVLRTYFKASRANKPSKSYAMRTWLYTPKNGEHKKETHKRAEEG